MTVTSMLFGVTCMNLYAWVRLWLDSGQACDRMGHSIWSGRECRRCGERFDRR